MENKIVLCPVCYQNDVRILDPARHPDIWGCQKCAIFFGIGEPKDIVRYYKPHEDVYKKYKYMWE